MWVRSVGFGPPHEPRLALPSQGKPVPATAAPADVVQGHSRLWLRPRVESDLRAPWKREVTYESVQLSPRGQQPAGGRGRVMAVPARPEAPARGRLPGLTLVKALPPPRSRAAVSPESHAAAAITHHPGPVSSCGPPCPLGWQHSPPHQAEAEPNSGNPERRWAPSEPWRLAPRGQTSKPVPGVQAQA